MPKFSLGQTLEYKDTTKALIDIKNMVKNNVDYIANNQLYLVDKKDDNGNVIKDENNNSIKVNSKQAILDQYNYFLEHATAIKNISINKIEKKVSKKNNKLFDVYTIAIRYSQKNGEDRCLYIYNLYDYIQLTPDKFNIKPSFLYTTLDKALTDYFNLSNIDSLEQLENLKVTFTEIQTIIDDIPHYNEQTDLLEYSENSPQSAAYFDGAHKTETYILKNDAIKKFIIQAIQTDLQDSFDNSKLSGKFGDSSHDTLHSGPGLGNSDLILTYNNVEYNVEVKNIYRADWQTGLKEAAKKAHKQPYMLAYIYHLNEFQLYSLDHAKNKANPLDNMTLSNNSLYNSLHDPENLPSSYADLYNNISTRIEKVKLENQLVSDSAKAVDELELLFN